jgi:hypothetical protein
MKYTEFTIKEWNHVETIDLYYLAGDEIQKEDLIDRISNHLYRRYAFENISSSKVIQHVCDQINMYDTLSEIANIINKRRHYKAIFQIIDRGHMQIRIYHLEDTQESKK